MSRLWTKSATGLGEPLSASRMTGFVEERAGHVSFLSTPATRHLRHDDAAVGLRVQFDHCPISRAEVVRLSDLILWPAADDGADDRDGRSRR